MKFLYLFICLFCAFQNSIVMEPESSIKNAAENETAKDNEAQIFFANMKAENEQILAYFKSIQEQLPRISRDTESPESEPPISYDARAGFSKNTAAQKLFAIMKKKQTLLGVNINTESLETMFQLLPLIAPNICLVKMCIEQYDDFSLGKIVRLKELSLQYNFMILSDSKFADTTPETIDARYTKGVYKIAQWADFVTVHYVAGNHILALLKKAVESSGIKEPRGAFVITQTVGLLSPNYTDSVLNAINFRKPDFLAGITHVSNMPVTSQGLIKLAEEEIPLNADISTIQGYLTEAIKNRKTDICILKLSHDKNNDYQKIQQLQNFCWNEYSQLQQIFQ